MNKRVSPAEQKIDVELQQMRLVTFQEDVVAPLLGEVGLNDYQQKALAAMVVSTEISAVTDLPVRTGKSYLMGRIAAKASDAGMSVTILSHRKHINSDHIDNLEVDGKEVVGIFDSEAHAPGAVSVGALQRVARATDRAANDKVDVLLIDEGHRAIGDKTVSNLHRLYPNAVMRVFTGSPNYAEDRSVSDFFGDVEISRTIIDAIEKGYVSPLRVLAYKTKAKIDLLDPGNEDFTSRELKNVRELRARNSAAVAMARDLVAEGRQGLVSTIPGGDLLHADILKKMLESETVTGRDGAERAIRAAVIKGSNDSADYLLEAYENGEYDVLLFCDKLVEGYTTEKASFLLDTRPTTSIVHLTQILGRVLQPKDKEAIVVSFVDETTQKRQKTFYDVVGLDRSVQGVWLGEKKSGYGSDIESDQDRYAVLRSLFTADLVDMFQKNDKRKIHDLTVPSERDYIDPMVVKEQAAKREKDREQDALVRKWESKLVKEYGRDIDGKTHYAPGSPDYMGLSTVSTRAEQTGKTYDGFPIMKLKDSAFNLDLSDAENAVKSIDEFNAHAKLPVRLLEDYAEFKNEAGNQQDDTIENLVSQVTNQQVNDGMMLVLDEREQDILRRRFLIMRDDSNSGTIESIGRLHGISGTQVRNVEAKALAKLRHTDVAYSIPGSAEAPEQHLSWAKVRFNQEKRLQDLEANAPIILQERRKLERDVETLFSDSDWGGVLKAVSGLDTSGRLNIMTAVAKELDMPISFSALSQLAREIAHIVDPEDIYDAAIALSEKQGELMDNMDFFNFNQATRKHIVKLIADSVRGSEGR